MNGGPESEKTILSAMILSLLGMIGLCGIHRFYAGKIGTGILQLITLGLFGIWQLIDFIFIVAGKFRDADGRLIDRWT